MNVSRFICVFCVLIVSLFSANECATAASVLYTKNFNYRFKGSAYSFKCPLSCFSKSVWNMQNFLQKNTMGARRLIACCVSNDDFVLFTAEQHNKDLRFDECILKYENANAKDSHDLYLSVLSFRKEKELYYEKPRRFLIAIMKLYQYQNVNQIPMTAEENSVIGFIMETLSNIAEISVYLVASYLDANYKIKVNTDMEYENDEIVEVILLIDNSVLNIYNISGNNKEYQSVGFPCIDNKCNFSDISWENLYKHIRNFHPFKFPSMLLSKNKLNDKNRRMNIFNENTDYVSYISCQACLAEKIQNYTNYLKLNGIQPSFSLIMKNFLKPQYNIRQTFKELGYGSIESFIQRHMIML